MAHTPLNHLRNSMLAVMMILLISSFLFGCDPYSGRYPYEKQANWVCVHPAFTISYSYNENDSLFPKNHLEWNGRSIDVEVAFQAHYFEVFPKNSTKYADKLFGGRWVCRQGNLILIIEDDYFFDGQFSELIFVPSE